MRLNVLMTISMNTKPVFDATDKAAFKNLSHFGASVRKDVQASFPPSRRKIFRRVRVNGRRRKRAFYTPSPVGGPPGLASKRLSRAIAYKTSKYSVVVGSRYKTAGKVGLAHEKGGVYKGQRYRQRPFMAPAFKRALPRVAGRWRGTVGQ
jgi:hypothetical protein